jgi:hypothetical protein
MIATFPLAAAQRLQFRPALCVANIAALNEIGAEQSFDDGVLFAFFTGKPDHALVESDQPETGFSSDLLND